MISRARTLLRTAISRGLLFLLLWLVLMPSLDVVDLGVGFFAAAAATWTSVRLMPPAVGYVRLRALLGFVPHFLWQSIVAGADVARRAMHPRIPLAPGFISIRVGFPPGLARNDFVSIMGLMPGSQPVVQTEDSVVFHCLDMTLPMVEQLAEEERLLGPALVAVKDDRG